MFFNIIRIVLAYFAGVLAISAYYNPEDAVSMLIISIILTLLLGCTAGIED